MNTVKLTSVGKLVICLLGSSIFLFIGWKCALFIFVIAMLYFFGPTVLKWINGENTFEELEDYASKQEKLKKKLDTTIKQLDICHKKLLAIPASNLPLKAQYIAQIQYYKGLLDNLNSYKSETMMKVIKRDAAGKILVVQNIETLTFYGIGDTIVHYSNEKAEIINIKEDGMKTKFLYNYLPLNEDLGELRENWTKHDAAFSNINAVMQHCEQTAKVKDAWWVIENKRRDELPRFMVKIMYPNSIYKIGQIVDCFDKNFKFNKETLAFCEEYPEIFEKVSSSLGDITKSFGILEFSDEKAA